MAKEKNYNPVQAQRKADKAKAIKKGMDTKMLSHAAAGAGHPVIVAERYMLTEDLP